MRAAAAPHAASVADQASANQVRGVAGVRLRVFRRCLTPFVPHLGLRVHRRVAALFPFDHTLLMHKIIAYVICFCTFLHGTGQSINYVLCVRAVVVTRTRV